MKVLDLDPVESSLVIVAHPDDAEFRAGGTMAALCARGATVDLAVLTDGGRGTRDAGEVGGGIAARREREQQEAGAIVGVASVSFFGERDLELAVVPSVVERVVELLCERRPQVVITHDPWRRYLLHPDHEAAGQIVRRAVLRAREPSIQGDRAWSISELWLFAADEPDVVVDVTPHFSTKMAAILAHGSQHRTDMGIEEGTEADIPAFVERQRARFARYAQDQPFELAECFRRVTL